MVKPSRLSYRQPIPWLTTGWVQSQFSDRCQEAISQCHPTLDAVLAALCQAYDLAETDLASSSRARPVAEARAVSALLVRETPGLILAELAKRIGQDASSISQAARRLDERIKAGDPVLARLKDLRGQFPVCHALPLIYRSCQNMSHPAQLQNYGLGG